MNSQDWMKKLREEHGWPDPGKPAATSDTKPPRPAKPPKGDK